MPTASPPQWISAPSSMRLAATKFALGDRVAPDKSAVPIELVARTNDPVEVWWADAPIVHDFAGIEHKDRLVLDWCHQDDEVIGFLDAVKAEGSKLMVSGSITPIREGDRAERVIDQGKAGIPFEASITWSPVAIDYLPEGTSTPLNGEDVEGPLMIVRRWKLHSVAVCPTGADGYTSSRFSRQAADDRRAVPVTRFGATMPDDKPADPKTPTTPATPNDQAPPAGEPQKQSQPPAADPPAAPPAAEPVAGEAEGADKPATEYFAAFGEERGAVYFAKGIKFAAAAASHIKWQNDQLTQYRAQAEAGGATPPAGKPVGFQGETNDNKTKKLFNIRGR